MSSVPGTVLQAPSTTVGPGIQLTSGVDGFRPAVQARTDTSYTSPADKTSAGVAATYSLGNRASISAYANYEVGDPNNGLQLRAGITAEYNNRSGASAAAGVRLDYNNGNGISPYGSVITRSHGGGTSVEAGACTNVSGKIPTTGNATVDGLVGVATGGTGRVDATVCAGVQRNSQGGTSFVLGFNKTF